MKRLDEIFTITYGVNLELCRLTESDALDAINYVSRTKQNNGVSARVVKMDGVKPNPGNTISVALTGSVLEAFYQEEEYYSGRDIAYMTPKGKMDKYSMIMYCAIIKFNQYKYCQGRGANKTIGSLLVPDLDEIKQFRTYNRLPSVKQIPSYFLNEGYARACWYMDKIDQEAFEKQYAGKKKHMKIKLSDRQWKDIKIKDIFDTYTGGDLILSSTEMGDIPIISHTAVNNGVGAYAATIPGRQLFDHRRTISLADRGTFFAARQMEDFYIGTRVKALVIKKALCKKPSKYAVSFIAAVINYESFRYSYGRNCTNGLDNLHIKLPINDNGELDWKFMENYIKSLPFSCNV